MADLSCIQRRYPTLGEGNQPHSQRIPHASGLVRVVRIVILSVEVPAFKLYLPDDFPESVDCHGQIGRQLSCGKRVDGSFAYTGQHGIHGVQFSRNKGDRFVYRQYVVLPPLSE